MRASTSIAAAVLAATAVAGCSQGNVFDLAVGTCYDEPDATGEVADVPIVDCSEPHDLEVYHAFDLPDGEFPGDAAINAAIEDGCLGEFEGFVGEPYPTSAVDISPLTPTEASWEQGDREILCSAYLLDGSQHTGSLEGSGL